jgi:hypothetical protein
MEREAKPVAAFSWGFLLDRGQIVPRNPQSLPLSAWTEHFELLEASYPTWAFMTANPAVGPTIADVPVDGTRCLRSK